VDERPKYKNEDNKTLRTELRRNLHDFGFASDFLDRTPKAQPKEKDQ